jgi:hypothetical protein
MQQAAPSARSHSGAVSGLYYFGAVRSALATYPVTAIDHFQRNPCRT